MNLLDLGMEIQVCYQEFFFFFLFQFQFLFLFSFKVLTFLFNKNVEFTSEVFLLVNGNVTFEYKVYAPSLEEDEPGFRFFVDKEEIMFSRDTNFRFFLFIILS